MLKTAIAGLVALTAIGSTLAVAQDYGADGEVQQASTRGPVLTQGHIARLRGVLKLTPEQQRHWPAVEAALRQVVAQQRQAASGNLVQRWGSRASGAVNWGRVAAAARPLIGTLDDGQKRDAMAFAHSMGISHVAAAF
jgi:zinc resistance-associated protein